MFETEAQIEEFKNDVASALKEVQKKGDKIPNPSFKELDLVRLDTIPEMRTAVLGKFSSLNELNNQENTQKQINELGRKAVKIIEQFRADTVALEEDERFTEQAKKEIYKTNRNNAMVELKEIAKKQGALFVQFADIRNTIAGRAWESIQATTVESLTPNDFAYIDLMLKQGGDRKELAKRYNYNPRVLDILNAGLTRFSGKVLGGRKALDGNAEKREYIANPLESLIKNDDWVKTDNNTIWNPDSKTGLRLINISEALKLYRNRPMF